MTFFNNSGEPPFYVDTNKYKAIAVITSFATDGKMMPIYIRYIHQDASEETIKIDSVDHVKSIVGGFEYRCYVTICERRHQIVLTYYIKIHTWFMNK